MFRWGDAPNDGHGAMTNATIIGLLLLIVLVALIIRWLEPSPPPDEAVTLTIVPGPIEEQEQGDSDGIDSH